MLRVLTWNIAFGQPEKVDALFAVLNAAQADVITLNEADDKTAVADLAQRLGMTHVWARGSGDRHVATLSRYAIMRWQIYNQKPLTQAALSTTIDYRPDGKNPLTVYNVHLRPDPFWHYEAIRYLAANALLSVVKREKSQPSLIMGDLNTYGKGDPVDVETILRFMREKDKETLRRQRYKFLRLSHGRLLRGGFSDCYRKLHSTDAGYTFTRHGHPVNRMDYVMADKPMAARLRHCETRAGDLDVSDHFPSSQNSTNRLTASPSSDWQRHNEAHCRDARAAASTQHSNVCAQRDAPAATSLHALCAMMFAMTIDKRGVLEDGVFDYQEKKDGKVFIFWHKKHVKTLKDGKAERFLAQVADATELEAQLVMAKVTGNFKRGNERAGTG